jgi:uncharacterized protein involved in exopolysaccharide biosynthesis
LSTDSFRLELLQRADLLERGELGEWPPRTPLQNFVEDIGLTRILGVRSVLKTVGLVRPETVEAALDAAMRAAGESVSVEAGGGNLLHITYLGNDRGAAARLVEAAIETYRDRTVQQRLEDVQQSIAFYSEQLQLQDQRQREASDTLQAFLRAHPAPALGQPRPGDEAAQLDTLRQAVRIEQALYENLVRTLESVRIDGEAERANQVQRIQIVDAADAPKSGGLGVKSLLLVLLTGAMVGVMFGGAAILWLTWLDSKVRSREDVAELVNAPVHLQVPQAPRGSKHWPHMGQLLTKDM